MSLVHVAVGVVLNSHNEVLIALRAKQAHQGGLWEFPGGKVEADETIQQALVRELKEELNIIADCFKPLVVIEHDYGDKTVRLDVWLVTRFDGVPVGCEGQQVTWSTIDELTRYEFPAANKKIIEKIFSLRAAGLPSDV
jgi:8-oxo-dGTP diphosphatase